MGRQKKSNLTDKEWCNVRHMLTVHTNRELGADILRNKVMGHEGDMYKALFLLLEHRIISGLSGNQNPLVNYYWTFTEELKDALLAIKPWSDDT